jgi:uncharacterized protein HemX
MRDDDPDGPGKPIDHELRDVHRRLDKLDEHLSSLRDQVATDRLETTRQFAAVREAVATRVRFPASAYGAAATLLVAVLGTGFVLYGQLQIAATDSAKALSLIEDHLKAAPTHRYNVENLARFADDVKDRLPKLEAQVESLQGRIVGNTSDGWHRRDHELYAELVAARFAAIEQRMSAQEQRSVQRDAWWQRLWDSGALKGQRP